MTKRTTHDGYYVTARLSGGANARTSWLMGPFEYHRAALLMVEPVRHTVNRHSTDPRFAFAWFGTAKKTVPIDQQLTRGRFDFDNWCDDDYVNDVINASREPPK